MDEQLSYATCANLLDYPDSAGPDGMRLRPEIAAAMPTISRDGRTYTLPHPSGFRFSPPSNEPVTAATFRHTIERDPAPEGAATLGVRAGHRRRDRRTGAGKDARTSPGSARTA